MNPFAWIVTQTMGRLLTRECPECGYVEHIPREKRRETVHCGRCGTPLPPPDDDVRLRG